MTPEISSKIDGLTHWQCIELACAFASYVLPLFEGRFRSDERPRRAIAEARKVIVAPSIARPEHAAALASQSFFAAMGENEVASGNAAQAAHYAAMTAVSGLNSAYNCKACINFAEAATLERAREVALVREQKRQEEFFAAFFEK